MTHRQTQTAELGTSVGQVALNGKPCSGTYWYMFTEVTTVSYIVGRSNYLYCY